MEILRFFFESSLSSDDAVAFAKAVQICFHTLGGDRCWCMDKSKHSSFQGFVTSHGSRLLYKNQDARPFLLALSNRFYSDDRPVIVRRSCCTSKYCLNPSHAYYGTRSDVALENETKKPQAKKRRTVVTVEMAEQMRQCRDAGETILKLSRRYKLPYHVARRICSENAYSSYNGNFSTKYLEKLWQKTIENCVEICKNNPEASRSYNLAYHVSTHLECPWHRKGQSSHKGNFGLMGECLDCMEEIKKGRCTVDVREFDLDWYWQVKRFWEQVDIKSNDECWLWRGATRRDNKESLAYFPSPFHSGKVHSAPRVAFWLSRGYTGKYRVFNKNTCEPFCCNPLHITIRELKGCPDPTGIADIQLVHTNVFQHYRKNLQQEQSNSAVELPPS
jgi:hypothetical protein